MKTLYFWSCFVQIVINKTTLLFKKTCKFLKNDFLSLNISNLFILQSLKFKNILNISPGTVLNLYATAIFCKNIWPLKY